MSTHPVESEKKGSIRGKPTSKACDRCRKRKQRCDEAIPCNSCLEVKATCTHAAPVLKRGPRKKPTSDLEKRLRNLESLLSTIPATSSSQSDLSAALSSNELERIRTAAHTSPDSEISPSDPSIYQDKWLQNIGTMSTNMESMEPGPSYAVLPSPLQPTLSQNEWLMPGQEQSSVSGIFTGGDNGMELSGASQSLQKTPGSETVDDLLYRDMEGQTRWLGPSSGMPLLERLKPTTPTPATSTLSLPEEWISLSAAIGMDLGTQDTAQPSGGPSNTTVKSGYDTVSNQTDTDAWSKLLAICPQDLVDSLVRGYFTISHLLWPILHAPTFMAQYASAEYRQNTSFVALVLSICCLSSRYVQDPRLTFVDKDGTVLAAKLLALAAEVVQSAASQRADLWVVQALFNMAVVQEGTSKPSLLWVYLGQALTTAMELGLHRRVDAWSTFSVVDVEVRKRTFWAIYAQHVKASCTHGRPLLIRLSDVDLDEPAAVDDVYISEANGLAPQPLDRPSVMAGFVAAIRIHMVLERIISRINQCRASQPDTGGFLSLMKPDPVPSQPQTVDEHQLLLRVTDGLPGEWTFTAESVADPDNVRFFQKTRVSALQHFLRLLLARHEFSQLLLQDTADMPNSNHFNTVPNSSSDLPTVTKQIAQSALALVGTYCVIESRGRLGFFGAHAIAQLTQAAAGLISVILHTASTTWPGSQEVSFQASQGLPMALQVLRQLGKRRIAGARAAELLAEFSRACRIPIYTGLDPAPSALTPSFANGSVNSPIQPNGTLNAVEVPMLRSLPRRKMTLTAPQTDLAQVTNQQEFDRWLNLALDGMSDWGEGGKQQGTWMG